MSQPISPELREWLVSQLAAGHSVPALRASMRAAGWQDAATDLALAQLEAGFPHVEVARPRRTEMPGPDLEGAPLYIDAGDRRVQVLQTMRHPRVVVFGNLVSPEECEGLIAAARVRLARSLTVETRTGVFFSYDRPDPATRTLHGGAPVLAGEKWVATKWLREREFK